MQLKIKHNVVAVTLEKDLQAHKGDILVVSSDGTGHPAVLPGLSFEVAFTELTKPTAIYDVPPALTVKKQPTPQYSTHVQKRRLHADNVVLTDKEYRYLGLLTKYDEAMTTKDIAILLDESYSSHGAIQTNILRPMVTAKMIRRMHTVSEHQRNGVYGYQITRKGKKVLRDNSQLKMKEVV